MNNEQQNNPSYAPNTTPISPISGGEHKKSGPMIGILIIIVLLVIAALYFWIQKGPSADNTSATTQQQNSVSSAAVEKAVQNDPESAKIDAELDSQLNGVDSANF